MRNDQKRGALCTVLLSTALTALVLLFLSPPLRGQPPVTLPPVNYGELASAPRATSWHIPDYPRVETMRENMLHTFKLCESEFEGLEGTIYGLVPASEYGMIFVRDTSTMMPGLQYFYGDQYLRTPIEEFLRRQYGPDTRSIDGDVPGHGAISAVIAPYGQVDKATAVSDEEIHLIHAAYHYYRTVGGADWLQKELAGATIILRLNQALDWLYVHRFDHDHQLIKRGHTTDWGDIKFESALDPTDLDPRADHWTFSPYDQALTYRALLELAEMNQAVGDSSRARGLQQRANQLRLSANEKLWNSHGGFYLIHLHLTPLLHPFPEMEMIGIGNALATYVGLADHQRAQSVFGALERARLAAGAGKPGLSLYPPYPEAFFAHAQMVSGEYQNGGLWDWWGGVQITAEFKNGSSSLAWAHLRMVADDWARHPEQIFEWQIPETGEGWGAEHYASAAATMAEAVVDGLFGVQIERDGVRLQPRLKKHDGQIRVLQPASGFYASYDYTFQPGFIALDYGSNHPKSLEIRILLPPGRETEKVSIDGLTTPHRMETVLEDTYCVFGGPSGVHRAIVSFQSPRLPAAFHTVSDSNPRIRPS